MERLTASAVCVAPDGRALRLGLSMRLRNGLSLAISTNVAEKPRASGFFAQERASALAR